MYIYMLLLLMVFLCPARGNKGGGQKYKAAALGVQHEVEDIRQELVKLLKTINSTNDGILGAENEIQKKVGIGTSIVLWGPQCLIFYANARLFVRDHSATSYCLYNSRTDEGILTHLGISGVLLL